VTGIKETFNDHLHVPRESQNSRNQQLNYYMPQQMRTNTGVYGLPVHQSVETLNLQLDNDNFGFGTPGPGAHRQIS